MTDKMIAVPRELLEALVEILDRADTSEGYCCCGDSMQNHPSPMYCGHSPVDAGVYYAGQRRDELKALLRESAQPDNGDRPEDVDALLRRLGLDPDSCRTECGFLNVTKTLSLLRDSDEELRRDAARYRWLRNHYGLGALHHADHHLIITRCEAYSGAAEGLDRSIDAAIAAEKKEEE